MVWALAGGGTNTGAGDLPNTPIERLHVTTHRGRHRGNIDVRLLRKLNSHSGGYALVRRTSVSCSNAGPDVGRLFVGCKKSEWMCLKFEKFLLFVVLIP